MRVQLPASSTDQETVAAGFLRQSSNGVIRGCVGAVDGWLCSVKVPSITDFGGLGRRPYFSGHYSRYGLNVQAMCDSCCRFLFVEAVFPGGTNDARAYREGNLRPWVEGLGRGLYIVGDNAYSADIHLLTPFLNSTCEGDMYRDAFNFHHSQCRIRVEMTFALLTQKWRIFQRRLDVRLGTATKIIHAAAVLHNLAIDDRLGRERELCSEELTGDVRPSTSADSIGQVLGYTPSDPSEQQTMGGTCFIRDQIVEFIREQDIRRPVIH